MKTNGVQWSPLESNGIQCSPTESNEVQWSPMVSNGTLLERSPVPICPITFPVERYGVQ